MKKTVGKTRWFRTKRRAKKKTEDRKWWNTNKEEMAGTNNQEYSKTNARNTTKTNKEEDIPKKELRTASVLFVPNTKDSLLAKNLREVVERLKNILGYNVKIVELSGTPLKLMFPLTKIEEGVECGRTRGEVLPPCKKRSVVYMNICTKCNPGVETTTLDHL